MARLLAAEVGHGQVQLGKVPSECTLWLSRVALERVQRGEESFVGTVDVLPFGTVGRMRLQSGCRLRAKVHETPAQVRWLTF